MSTSTEAKFIDVASLDDLKHRTCIVVRGEDRPIAVFYDAQQDQVYAVDNRCPHMGFPLHKGSIKDGMITCHWHHARFDGASGCTFDPFADDVEAFDVDLRDGQVYVAGQPRARDARRHAITRMRQAMEQNISLVSAKSILTLRSLNVSDAEIMRELALFGLRNRDDWGPGMTVLSAVTRMLPHLSEKTAYLGQYQAARRVASDCAGMPPRRSQQPLTTDAHDLPTLQRWLKHWTTVRHSDAAERTLLTAINSSKLSREDLVETVGLAVTERFYASAGHLLDFTNKAMELLDAIGWDHADEALVTLVPQLTSSRGGEETNSWRYLTDLVPIIRDLSDALPARFEAAKEKGAAFTDEQVAALAEAMLGEEPEPIFEAIGRAADDGASPRQVSRALAYAAAVRVARFGTSNEQGDWIGALHSFSYCNGVDQLLARCESPVLVRGVLHGAASVYLNRFLNVPPAKLPGEKETLDDEPADADELLDAFIEALDSQRQVDKAARLVARYLALKHDPARLIDTLAYAVLREDFDFHSLQMVEAGVRQYQQWGDSDEGRVILIAIARYLAAHSPTQRGQLQTANIALRLHRGDDVYEEDE